jgi:uncharacterized protein YjbJ (UPF0337 family)
MKQESRGKVMKLKGRVREAAGIITGNRKLERQGARQRAVGAVHESVGKARRRAGGLASRAATAIKG